MSRDYNYLTDEEKLFISENYLLLSDERLAEVLSRTPANIRKLRQLLGLKRRGVDLREVVSNTPIVIWMPRKAFDGFDIDYTQLKIKGQVNETN